MSAPARPAGIAGAGRPRRTRRLPLKRDHTKLLQVGFVVLLAICSAQVAWWIGESLHHDDAIARRLAALYGELAHSHAATPATALPPYLERGADGAVRVTAAVLADLEETRAGRARRYAWEGGFFLLVLVSGMAVVAAAIRHDVALRRRQQNFLAGVSHEFKSPLASIRLAAESLARHADDDATRRWTPRIITDCERLLRTVDNLLDTARLEEGRHPVTPRRVSLADAVTHATDEHAARAAAESITLEQTISPADLALEVDPEALATILRNLLDNALKACAAGDGSRIAITAGRAGDGVELAVSDDGCGFPPGEAARLFEKFYQVGDDHARRSRGSGLGLYLVTRLVALSGGRVVARSPGPGQGATVLVSWPQGAAHG
ncbi:MAG: HAMP domain-containing sensor histidine kinase [Gammaproteobacteria bacterium]